LSENRTVATAMATATATTTTKKKGTSLASSRDKKNTDRLMVTIRACVCSLCVTSFTLTINLSDAF
jgi:hypothetical protein